MERLIEVVQELSLARDLDAITSIVRRAARELTGADGATFVLRDQESEPVNVAASAGHGLGLAFCRAAVEAHGGAIWVESGPIGGSVFVVRLPSAEQGAPTLPPS